MCYCYFGKRDDYVVCRKLKVFIYGILLFCYLFVGDCTLKDFEIIRFDFSIVYFF